MAKYQLVTPELFDQIEQEDRDTQANWLFLEQSEEFRGYWQVSGIWEDYFFDFEPLIGNYRLVSPLVLDDFLALAKEKRYEPVFLDDPMSILDAYKYLSEPPPITLNSTIEGNVQGFLPWQITGFNKLVRNEDITGGYVVWLTGGGKAFFMASAIRYHQEIGHPFDLALVVVKSHNKIDTQRKLKSLGDIDSIVLAGTAEKRGRLYAEVENALDAGEQRVVITNYEKFREDMSYFQSMLNKRNVLFFWDEMPTRLSNRETQLYKSVKKSLYSSFYSKPRPKWMRHWALTATPIENSPGDVFSCVNIMWPGLLGSVTEFKQRYVATYNPISGKPQRWQNLDRLEAELQFITHRVSKEDPEVARMFPEALPMPTDIDWHPRHRSLYDKLTGKAKDLIDEDTNILALIQIMQMVCDAPSMIKKSAENREEFVRYLETMDEDSAMPTGNMGSDIAMLLLKNMDLDTFTNKGHTKLEMWREIICEKFPDEKVITYSTWADYIFPVWEEHLNEWGVSYVVYRGTDKQKQTALDNFRDDPSIRVFLSGDAGSDGIDISEAVVGVNYNIPWKWTTLKQREGRRDRVNSTFNTIYTYSLIMPDSVDERKLAVCDQKFEYHSTIFDGKAQEEALSATMTRDDLLYLLLGD